MEKIKCNSKEMGSSWLDHSTKEMDWGVRETMNVIWTAIVKVLHKQANLILGYIIRAHFL